MASENGKEGKELRKLLGELKPKKKCSTAAV